MLMFMSLILNSIMGIIKIKDEFKRGENNNLYYIAQSGSDIFLCALNKILDLSIKQSHDSDKPIIQIIDENVQKYFGEHDFNLLNIKNGSHYYLLSINNLESTIDLNGLVYKIQLCTIDRLNNNKIKLSCEYTQDGNRFIISSNKLINN